MAVANSKSASITSLDASPPVPVGSYKHAGHVLQSYDSVEVAAADDDNSVYRMVRVPSNARILELGILNDAIAGATDYDLGVYETAENGGGVADANLFSSGISMVTGRTLPLNAKYESTNVNIANGDDRLWEVLGLSSDPNKFYDICYTANTVGSAAGTLALECKWSQ